MRNKHDFVKLDFLVLLYCHEGAGVYHSISCSQVEDHITTSLVDRYHVPLKEIWQQNCDSCAYQ